MRAMSNVQCTIALLKKTFIVRMGGLWGPDGMARGWGSARAIKALDYLPMPAPSQLGPAFSVRVV